MPAAALVLWSAATFASPNVVWTSTPACIEPERLDVVIDELAGGRRDAVELGATAMARGRWRVTVGYAGESRTIEGSDCATLTDAAALIVAVRIDAIAVASRVEIQRPSKSSKPQRDRESSRVAPVTPAEPPAEAVAGASSSVAVPTMRTPSPERAPRPAWRPTASLGVAGAFGSLPRGGASFEAGAGARRGRLQLGAGAVATFGPSSRTLAEGVSMRMWLVAGMVEACGVLDAGTLSVPLCGRTEVGLVRAVPSGLTRPNEVTATWLAPGGSIGLAPRRWRWRPEAFAAVVSPVLQHRFVAEETGQLHRLPPVVVRLGVRLRWGGLPK